MPLKSSNSVAVERRVDLASFFCMIGRHGPAVALAVIAMVSVVAGFIIYRTVREKRRKATAEAADRGGEDAAARTLVPPDEEPEPSREEPRGSAESTAASDGDSLDVKEDATLKLRHRRFAVKKKSPPSCQPERDSVEDNKHNTLVKQVAEEESQSYTVAEMDVETVCHQDETNGPVKDAEEDSEKETEKVSQERSQEEEGVPTETDVSDEKTAQEEGNPQCVSKGTKRNLEEPLIHMEAVPVSSICYAKNVKFLEQNLHPDSIESVDDYSNNQPFPEDQNKTDSEAVKGESGDGQLIAQQEISFPVFEKVTNLQDQRDAVLDELMSVQRDADEGHFNDSSAADSNGHLLHLTEQNKNGLACSQGDDVVKGEILTGDDTYGEGHDGSSAVLNPTLPCLNQTEPAKADDGNASLCSITTDAKNQISGTVEIPALSSDCQCPQSNVNEDGIALSLGVTNGTAPVRSEDINPPMCQMRFLSFDQSELTWLSSGPGGESGISSMAVSPDLSDVGNECDKTAENASLPVIDCDAQFEEQTEAQKILFADEVALSVNGNLAGVVSGSCPSHLSQQPLSEHTDWANEFFADNEDIFGHEIEDGYHRELEHLMVQISANVNSLTDELTIKTEMKADAKVVEIKQKVEGEEDEYEKTEISIMEATMDNNEWITDGNYQFLPWMNQSVPTVAQNHSQRDPLPTEENNQGASVADAACTDADVSPSPEVRQTISLSPIDENVETGKKVVAVQPMPQNANVTFRIHYNTHSPYQKVAITGNQQELGNWKDFIPLERAKDGHWATVVSLPVESHVEWKFVVVEKGEVCRWEECGNRLLDTGYGEDMLVHKSWGFL